MEGCTDAVVTAELSSLTSLSSSTDDERLNRSLGQGQRLLPQDLHVNRRVFLSFPLSLNDIITSILYETTLIISVE